MKRTEPPQAAAPPVAPTSCPCRSRGTSGHAARRRGWCAVKRQWPLHEPVAHGGRRVGFAIPLTAGVISRYLKPLPVQHLEPSPDRNFPVRVLPEKAADDPQPDLLVGVWRPGQKD